MKTPCHRDWERIKRLLKYINGTKNYGLTYRSERDSSKLQTFVGVAFGVDAKRERIMTGYVVHLGDAPILWRSRLQTTVAYYLNASEYIALYEAAVATAGVQNLADTLGIRLAILPPYTRTMMVYDDSPLVAWARKRPGI